MKFMELKVDNKLSLSLSAPTFRELAMTTEPNPKLVIVQDINFPFSEVAFNLEGQFQSGSSVWTN